MFIILKLNRNQSHQILELLAVETNHNSAKKPACSHGLQNQAYLGEIFLAGRAAHPGAGVQPPPQLCPPRWGRNNNATVNNKLWQTVKLKNINLHKQLELWKEAIYNIWSDLKLPLISGLCVFASFLCRWCCCQNAMI